MRTKRILFVFSLILAMALPLASVSAADPIALQDGVKVTATLTGNMGGAFHQYLVEYPGDEVELAIKLFHWPPNPLTGCGIGFKVYGWNGFEGQGVQSPDDQALIAFTYKRQEPTTFLVQVQCYSDGHDVTYELTATGLAAPKIAAAPVAVQEAKPAVVAGSVSGTLTGNTGGGLKLHLVSYPGDEEDTEIRLVFWPADPSIGNAVGFNVYSPSGKLVAEGQVTEVGGEREAVFSSDEAGNYTVQIYNYIDGLQVSYLLEQSR